jgi:hypothetical protein
MMCQLFAGASVQHTSVVDTTTETLTWHNTNATARLFSGGQLYLGGQAPVVDGEGSIEVGGLVRAGGGISLRGESDRNNDGLSIKLPFTSGLGVKNANGWVDIEAAGGGALVNGFIGVSNDLLYHYPENGERQRQAFSVVADEAATGWIRVQSQGDQDVGGTLKAPQWIALDALPPLEGQQASDLTLRSTARIQTFNEGSSILLKSSGFLTVEGKVHSDDPAVIQSAGGVELFAENLDNIFIQTGQVETGMGDISFIRDVEEWVIDTSINGSNLGVDHLRLGATGRLVLT